MKKVYILSILFFIPLTLISCRKEIKSEKGGIDVISNVYFHASKGLNVMQTFHISKINYSNDSIMEIIPDLHFSEISLEKKFIKDSLCYSLGETPESVIISELVKKQKPILVYQKKSGAIFSKEEIPNYRNRKRLADTILFNKKYKRFEINSPWIYTRFYIYPTDTILPYSLYKHAENDYGGRLERIDSYNKNTDAFVTLQIIPRKEWDSEAKEFFSFNHYIIRKIPKK
ncbi:hypothetical protein D1631_05430 [Chryseobacterium nematophagum]|uniref:Lipoprotein n=1 Tax=Chryseobacterium nematophagum TaxID=2305228 RepID=A0A3M7TCW0_9FLAO|nr:hypothetical protein [Chryseobacterium nematophagum]RNA61412.1 hypothetical protein D1631_05430 [Chryseobacterium nematophagum]